jgi:serine/threonine-protein kinase
MSSRNTGEEAEHRVAEEEKELEASVDHERLARLVAANSPPTVEDGRRAEAEAQRRLDEVRRRVEAARLDKRLPRNQSADIHSYEPVLLRQQARQSEPVSRQAVASPYASVEQKKSLRSMMLLIAVVLGVIMLGGISTFFMLSFKGNSENKPTATPPGKQVERNNGTGPVITKQQMIAIPGGTFMMGRNDGPSQEAPAHSVTVSDFSMDKTEVTNAEYAEFVNETRRTPPVSWSEGKVLPGQEQWPVNNVSLDDAKAFAAWRSKRDGVTYRLPTEEEWEYAARNGQNTLYPWGDSWANDSAVVKMYSPQAVGSMPNGKNLWGVVDLIGNVWEWTSSPASMYPGNRKTIAAQDEDSYVMRGGSYASEPGGERAITATFRDWIPASTRHSTLGFRLVRAGS